MVRDTAFCLVGNLEYRACARSTSQCAPTVFRNPILVNAILPRHAEQGSENMFSVRSVAYTRIHRINDLQT